MTRNRCRWRQACQHTPSANASLSGGHTTETGAGTQTGSDTQIGPSNRPVEVKLPQNRRPNQTNADPFQQKEKLAEQRERIASSGGGFIRPTPKKKSNGFIRTSPKKEEGSGAFRRVQTR